MGHFRKTQVEFGSPLNLVLKVIDLRIAVAAENGTAKSAK